LGNDVAPVKRLPPAPEFIKGGIGHQQIHHCAAGDFYGGAPGKNLLWRYFCAKKGIAFTNEYLWFLAGVQHSLNKNLVAMIGWEIDIDVFFAGDEKKTGNNGEQYFLAVHISKI
jgi:hypothetical protein